jgi:hypothetical protein
VGLSLSGASGSASINRQFESVWLVLDDAHVLGLFIDGVSRCTCALTGGGSQRPERDQASSSTGLVLAGLAIEAGFPPIRCLLGYARLLGPNLVTVVMFDERPADVSGTGHNVDHTRRARWCLSYRWRSPSRWPCSRSQRAY